VKSKSKLTPKREKEILPAAEVVNKFIEDLIRKQELEKEFISNTEYILWLENFSIANPAFSDDDWLYCPEKIPKEDYKRVGELHLFFNGIMDYAERNFISPCYDEFGHFLFIKFNNVGYKIGKMFGQGTLTYCERVDISPDNLFIDFNDIMENKKQKNVDDINKKLDSMCETIEELIKIGVPSKTILKRVQNVFQNVSDEEYEEPIF